ncbi:MAG TPA: dynamin family protein [Pirellulales bacterium]|jgi:GTP-binding protein EngB required for normal cell division|nr:dynamin family protein [Pirellulales bacterium]
MFNENHKSHIRTVFQSVDELLSKMLQYLDSTHPPSPFSEHVPDATPVQGRVIADYAVRVRNSMLRLLQTHAIPLAEKRISAVWAARAAIMAARVSVDEMGPRIVRGYGALTDEDARALEAMIAQLQDILNRMDAFLAQGPGREMQSRLERLEKTGDAGRLLNELGQIITKYGLVEFRATLEMLAERFESDVFEIAVFGRVSSGKSSLLDYLLQTDALPVGVTPVTAIPIRTVYGDEARAVIDLAEAPSVVVAAKRLVEFAAEQQNPANSKHVTRIQLELPSSILRAGLAFVDTPGLGSLATAGSAESLWYLPRCDLGIVLVDASSTLVADDVSLVHSLYEAGADAMVLLSKADLLSDRDQQRAAEYARRQLHAEIARDTPVYSVSIKADGARLCDDWRREMLLPCLDDHRQRFQVSMRRKIGALRDAVVAALRKRIVAGPNTASALEPQLIEQSLSTTLAQMDRARYSVPKPFPAAGIMAHDVLTQAADRIASSWDSHAGPTQDVTGIVQSAADYAAQRIAAIAATGIQELNQAVTNTLQQCGDHSAAGTTDIIGAFRIAGLPLLDCARPELHAEVTRPLMGLFGKPKLVQGIQKQLESQVFRQLTAAFDRYQGRLLEWRRWSLDEMQRVFTAKAELHRSRFSPTECRTGESPQSATDIGRDIEHLIHIGDVAMCADTSADQYLR